MISESELKGILDMVKAILVEHPEEFITIKDMVNNDEIKGIIEFIKSKLNLKGEIETWMKVAIVYALCLPFSFLVDIEKWEDDDRALWAYKYKPDTQVDMLSKKFSQESYESMITEVREFFIKLELEAERRRVDALLEEFERRERERDRNRRDEDHDRHDL
jgi:hypothetical protein